MGWIQGGYAGCLKLSQTSENAGPRPLNKEAPKTPAIRLEGVSKYFPIYTSRRDRFQALVFGHRWRDRSQFAAIDNLSLEVKKGETLGILGVNGAGKSTLLQIIVQTLTASRGLVEIDGTISALLELGAGLNPAWTGRENALFQCRLHQLPESQIKELVQKVEEFADIGSFFDQPLRTYSSGMYMRVAFASAIMNEPDILIVDEALAVGDTRFQNKCFSRFKEFQKNGKTILFVTHAPDLVANYCSRAIVMDKGDIVFDGLPKDAIARFHEVMFKGAVAEPSAEIDQAEEAVSVEEVNLPAGVQSKSAPDRHRFFDPENVSDILETRNFYSSQGHRHGNGKATIIDVQLVEGDSANFGLLQSGSRTTLLIRVLANESIRDCSIGLNFNTIDGVKIHGTTSEMMSGTLFDIKKGDDIVAEFQFDASFYSGDYFVDISVSELQGGEYNVCDVRFSCIVLNVISAPSFNGLVNLNGDFSGIEHWGKPASEVS